jgi:hypothetical protein
MCNKGVGRERPRVSYGVQIGNEARILSTGPRDMVPESTVRLYSSKTICS